MNIGQASQQARIAAKMIRYYESIGLLPEPARGSSGYREYTSDDVNRLKFLQRARSLGFPPSQIKELLRLWNDSGRSHSDVRHMALAHAAELESKSRQLQEVIDTLRHLARACERGDRPDCPIIEALGGGKPSPPSAKALHRTKVGGDRDLR